MTTIVAEEIGQRKRRKPRQHTQLLTATALHRAVSSNCNHHVDGVTAASISISITRFLAHLVNQAIALVYLTESFRPLTQNVWETRGSNKRGFVPPGILWSITLTVCLPCRLYSQVYLLYQIRSPLALEHTSV